MVLGVAMAMSSFTGVFADEAASGGGAAGGTGGAGATKPGYELGATEAASGEGWTWNPTDAKLTLENANITANDMFLFDIKAGKDVTLDVKGSNSLVLESYGSDVSDIIKVDSNLTITGDGVLDINTDSKFRELNGINCAGDVSFKGNETVSINIGNSTAGIRGIEAENVTIGEADDEIGPTLNISMYASEGKVTNYGIAVNATGKYTQNSGKVELSTTEVEEKSLGIQANDFELVDGELAVKVTQFRGNEGIYAAVKTVNPMVADGAKVTNSKEAFKSGETTMIVPEDAEKAVKIRKVGSIELVYSESNGDNGTFDCNTEKNEKAFEIKLNGVKAIAPTAGCKVYDDRDVVVYDVRLGEVKDSKATFTIDFAPFGSGAYKVHAFVTDMSSEETEDSLTADFNVTLNKIDYAGTKEVTIPVDISKPVTGSFKIDDVLGIKTGSGSFDDPVDVSKEGVLDSVSVDETGVVNWTSARDAVEAGKTDVYTIEVYSGFYNPFTLTVKFVAKEKQAVTIKGIDAKNKVYDGKEYTVGGTIEAVTGEGESEEKVEIKDFDYKYYTVTETTTGEGEEATTTKDYTYVGTSVTNAGKYKVVISVPDMNADYTGSTEAEFEITKAELNVAPAKVRVTKGSTIPTEFKFDIKGLADADKTAVDNALAEGALAVFDGDKELENTNTVGNYKITWKTESDAERVKTALEDAGINTNYTVTLSDGTLEVYKRSSSSGGGGGSRITTYTVNFNVPGETKVTSVKVNKNGTVKEPTAPVKEGYVFEGWYTDAKYTEKYNFNSKVTKSFTLYAKFTEKDTKMVLKIGDPQATLFGKTVTNDVAPVIKNDRTMLPARFVAEGLGATVEWDETAPGIVTITKGEIKIVIRIGEETAVVNGKEVKLDSPAFIENDRTYTPVRFVAENLGAKVEWQEGSNEVVIIAQ